MRYAPFGIALIAGALAVAPIHALAGGLTHVPTANPKRTGVTSANKLSPELAEVERARGGMPLENPQDWASHFGYNNDCVQMVALPQPPGFVACAPDTTRVEATKTEPDKNTYLRLGGQTGADPHYDYGNDFVFQGHELGSRAVPTNNTSPQRGYITRVNLDADVDHRVTLMATRDVAGNPLPVFDGSTWYPWAQRLLFTSESGAISNCAAPAPCSGGVFQATLDVPSRVEDISGVTGRGGYEGIQADSDGNLWIVEDVGGTFGATKTHARRPNSFIYRLIPNNRRDLKLGGALQVLAVKSKAHAGNIVFDPAQSADVAIGSQDMADLHTYGNVFQTSWITIHDTATDGFAPFDANALAKAKGGTPFKRPENGVFRPGTHFGEFFFTETGDTDAMTEAGADHGGFGALFKVSQRRPSDNGGSLTLFYRGDLAHTGLDNIAFWSKDKLVAVEDGGDTLHTQRNALDSAYLFDVKTDYSQPLNQPLRVLAQGRDASATLDSWLRTFVANFQNDGDNEITGIHISDGDPSPDGILGAKTPKPFDDGWRVFYTRQHGDNQLYEIIPNPFARGAEHASDDEDDD